MLSRRERWYVLSGAAWLRTQALANAAARETDEAARSQAGQSDQDAGARGGGTGGAAGEHVDDNAADALHGAQRDGISDAGRETPRRQRALPSYKAYLEARGCSEEVLDEDELIDRDLGRMRAEFVEALFAVHDKQFKLDTVLAAARRVLRGFGTRNPNLGYVQGFHNMVVVLLSEFYEDGDPDSSAYEEERAFWVFCALCETILGWRFYAKEPRRLEGFMHAVESVSESIGRKKFHGIRSVDKEGVVQLLSLKWLLQLWADDAVIADAAVLKRIWDCVFLSAAGCGSMNPPESALRSVYSGRKPIVPRATDFHLRLAVAMIEDTPILAVPDELVDAGPEVEDDDEHRHLCLKRCSSDLETNRRQHNRQPALAHSLPDGSLAAPVATNGLGPADPDDASTAIGLEDAAATTKTSSAPHVAHFPPRAMRPCASLQSLQSLQDTPMLRRKASLEEMGGHATGFVYNVVLKRVRKLGPRKLEGLIALAEQIVLLKSDSPEAKALATAAAAQYRAHDKRDEELASKAVLDFIEKLSSSRSRSVPIRYSTFKRLALSACPTWTTSDIMAVFSTLDVSRSGQIPSHYLIQQLPFRFADRPVTETESLVTAIYTHSASQQDARTLREDISPDASMADESCTAGTGSSCALQ